MAFVPTHYSGAYVYDSANDTSLVSGSFSPTGDALLIAAIWDSDQDNAPPTMSDTLSGTGSWSTGASFASGTEKIDIMWAITGSSPGTGTVTATLDSKSRGKSISVSTIDTGYDSVTPFEQSAGSAEDASGEVDITLGVAPDSISLCLMIIGGVGFDGTHIMESGYTEFINETAATGDMAGQYKSGSGATTASMTGLGGGAAQIAALYVEINAGVSDVPLDVDISGAATVTPDLSATKPLDVQIDGAATVTPQITNTRPLDVDIAGASTVVATLLNERPFVVAIDSSTTVTAALSTLATLLPKFGTHRRIKENVLLRM